MDIECTETCTLVYFLSGNFSEGKKKVARKRYHKDYENEDETFRHCTL